MNNRQINDYICGLTSEKYYGFNKTSAKSINVDKIYACITSSKFRKTKIDDITKADIYKKIYNSISTKSPLSFSVPFGAYKSWRLNLDYRPDWAEVFNLSFLMKYAAHILTEYPYGVKFTYTYQSGLIYFVSDIPKEKVIQYEIDFQNLLNIFNKINSNVKFEIMKINNLYSNDEDYYIDFLKCFLDNLVFWDSKYDDATKTKRLQSALHNVNPNGLRHIGSYDEVVQDKYIYYSALMTDAIDSIEKRRSYNKGAEKIQLVCVKGPTKSINIGACETSSVHFWVGRGCLRYVNEIKPYIYTVSNMYKFLNNNECQSVEIKSVFSEISENFNSILYIKN